MTEKEKILAEIERLLALPEIGFDDGSAEHGYKEALHDIKSFIDSHPEEPVSKDLEEKVIPTKLKNVFKRTITIIEPDMTEYKIETKNEDICKRYGYQDVKLKNYLLVRGFVEHYINAPDDEKPYAHIGCERDTNFGWNVHFSEKDENKKTIIVEYLEFNKKV